jgi:hypothetical protein
MPLLSVGKATTGHSIKLKKCRSAIENIDRHLTRIWKERHGLRSKGFTREFSSAGLKVRSDRLDYCIYCILEQTGTRQKAAPVRTGLFPSVKARKGPQQSNKALCLAPPGEKGSCFQRTLRATYASLLFLYNRKRKKSQGGAEKDRRVMAVS